MIELTKGTTEVAATAVAKEPEQGNRKASAGARKPRVAKSDGEPGKKATSGKKVPKAAPKPRVTRPKKAAKEKGVREGSKTETILALLKRSGGITLKELVKATGWQAHSVRGFLSATVGKKMGLTVVSSKSENGDRTYSVKA